MSTQKGITLPTYNGVTEPTGAPEEGDDASSQNGNSDKGESNSEGSSCTDDYADEELVYDKVDDVYRCTNLGCGWEVAFGCCQGCQTKYITEVCL